MGKSVQCPLDTHTSLLDTQPALWDTSAALQGLDNNEALLQALLRAFASEGAARRERVFVALTDASVGNVRILREEAHALANSAGVLCCEDLLIASKILEKMAIQFLEAADTLSNINSVMEQGKIMLTALDDVLYALQSVQSGE